LADDEQNSTSVDSAKQGTLLLCAHETMRDAEARRMMREIAARYERLAQRVEADKTWAGRSRQHQFCLTTIINWTYFRAVEALGGANTDSTEWSNFYCLPGRAGDTPLAIRAAHRTTGRRDGQGCNSGTCFSSSSWQLVWSEMVARERV